VLSWNTTKKRDNRKRQGLRHNHQRQCRRRRRRRRRRRWWRQRDARAWNQGWKASDHAPRASKSARPTATWWNSKHNANNAELHHGSRNDSGLISTSLHRPLSHVLLNRNYHLWHFIRESKESADSFIVSRAQRYVSNT